MSEEFAYPIYKKYFNSNMVVRFDGLKSGAVIVGDENYDVGHYKSDWFIHTIQDYWQDWTPPNDNELVSSKMETATTRHIHKKDGNKYLVKVFSKDGKSSVETDVYRMIDACNVTNPALQHLIKKAMFTGLRGHKDAVEDYDNIIESSIEAKQIYLDGVKRND